MTAIDLLQQFRSMGIQLQVNGGKIRYHVPEPVIQAHPEIKDLLTELKAHKPEAIRLLKQQAVTTQKKTRAILLWSEKLQDHFWWLIDRSALPEIQRDGVPIYDSEEISIMLDAKDDEERKRLHSFKRIFNVKLRKQTPHR